MKRRALAMLLAIVMVFGLAACGSGTAESGTAGEQSSAAFTPQLDTEAEATVNIIGPLNNFEALEAVITDFQEIYPNCQVQYSYISYTDLLARLASDGSVGIFMTDYYRYQSYDFYKDYCANLLDEDIDLSALRSAALEASTVDGVVFGVPGAQNTSGLIVNETLLENAGLEVPQNYSELLAACETLKELGYTPLQAYGITTDSNYSYMYRILVRNMFSVLLADEYEDGVDLTALFEGQEGSADFLQAVFEEFETLFDSGYIDPDVNALYEDTYNEAILRFFEGDVPFLVGTAETYSGTKKRETKSEAFTENPFEYSFICAPLAEDGAYTFIENWTYFCLNGNCADKEWALEFMRFLATEEELNQLASIKGLPSAAANSSDERYAELYSGNEALLKYESFTVPTVVQDALSSVLIEIADGEVDSASACAEFERLIREPESETESAE